MSTLAVRGGDPVAPNFPEHRALIEKRELERRYLLEAYDSNQWDDWPEQESMASLFQTEWAEFNDSVFCALLTNGTHTLQIALESLDIGPGDEVIVPGLTWQATASAVCDVNAVPVLVDIDPETLCIDPARVRDAITSRTRAVIPVHLYHRMADLDALLAICRERDLYLIEDSAHTHGSRWRNQGAGTLGVFGSYSFQRSKLMNAGEGGALLMQDQDLYLRVVSQRSCGREFQGVKVHSGNYRITSFQAAILRGQLAAHRHNAPVIDRHGLALDAAVDDAPGVRSLRRPAGITRQCSYAFCFLYDSKAFDGLDVSRFREALGAELGMPFHSTYTPLHHSEVYYPHTKKRHRYSPEYAKSIDPLRWELPVAEQVWSREAVIAQWPIFNCEPDEASTLTDAITKVYDHRHELISAQ